MIQVGDRVPDIELRTDQATPLSLTDLHGRTLAVFLSGETFTPTVEQLLAVLEENTDHFLTQDVSPIVVLGESAERLSDFRKQKNLPYLMISDPGLELHNRLRGEDGLKFGVWIFDQDGVAMEVIPSLPPTELVRFTADRAGRARTT